MHLHERDFILSYFEHPCQKEKLRGLLPACSWFYCSYILKHRGKPLLELMGQSSIPVFTNQRAPGAQNLVS